MNHFRRAAMLGLALSSLPSVGAPVPPSTLAPPRTRQKHHPRCPKCSRLMRMRPDGRFRCQTDGTFAPTPPDA